MIRVENILKKSLYESMDSHSTLVLRRNGWGHHKTPAAIWRMLDKLKPFVDAKRIVAAHAYGPDGPF